MKKNELFGMKLKDLIAIGCVSVFTCAAVYFFISPFKNVIGQTGSAVLFFPGLQPLILLSLLLGVIFFLIHASGLNKSFLSKSLSLSMIFLALGSLSAFFLREDTLTRKFVNLFHKLDYVICSKFEYRGVKNFGHGYLFAKSIHHCPKVDGKDLSYVGFEKLAASGNE